MPVDWAFPTEIIKLRGVGKSLVSREDAERQTETAKVILSRLRTQPGVVLADDVGMGKTYVAMAVTAAVLLSTRRMHCPVVVMVPPGLRHKWQRDWEQFKTHCVRDQVLSWVRDAYAHTPTEFFKLLDDPPDRRAKLIFITTHCFFLGLHDPWVKLAMIRFARSSTRLRDTYKQRLYRWAANLVRQSSNSKLTEDIVQQLMSAHPSEWKRILVASNVLTEEDDDPVPDCLIKEAGRIDWTSISDVVRRLPARRPEFVKESLRREMRRQFSKACCSAYRQWLNIVRWRSPLLILDEAHHAKNDSTQLATLFRPESENDVPMLKDKFDRMLFLTATPFQLGHRELIRVLQSFRAVRWSSKESPTGMPENFSRTMQELEQAMDANRRAARRFDHLWGKLRPEMLPNGKQSTDEEQVLRWWRNVECGRVGTWENELLQAYRDCVEKKRKAELILRPWVIRHNRSPYLPGTADVPRRHVVVGKAVADDKDGVIPQVAEGLPIQEHVLLPFLITARAQGQLARSPGTRALFAEGLASSFEAFHHTREHHRRTKDFDDGLAADAKGSPGPVPTQWYNERIVQLIPSRAAPRKERLKHPKVSATVARAVDLWLNGEKVLVFCFYVQTAHALYEHLREEIHQKVIDLAGKKLGLDSRDQASIIQNWLARAVRRLADEASPFHREARHILRKAIDKPQYAILRPYRERLLGVLEAYLRSPSFVARYLPLDDSLVRAALVKRENRRNVIVAGIEALRRAVMEQKDASNQTYLGRIDQFLEFATELAERAERPIVRKQFESSDKPDNPLDEYLKAVSVYSRPRDRKRVHQDEVDEERDDGSYRVMPLVRMVYGNTKTEVRDRLMLAFNSPLFPEILVSSSVLSEGVDLHRFCRHVIHHDLCWNPSTLEQRTGRLDRVGCKAEVCLQPIKVYEPFLAGSADEKMFRVLRDRERWFQIVMGQKYEFDEAASEAIASRVPLPQELARELTFDLSCWPNPS